MKRRKQMENGWIQSIIEWLGTVGKTAIAVGASIGTAIGVAAMIWYNFMNKNKQTQIQQHVPTMQAPPVYQNQCVYGGGWAY